MPTYHSKRLLERLHDHTEEMLDRAVSEWQLMSHSQFARKPEPQKWSANECLQHLNSYCRYYLPEIEKAVARSVAMRQPDSGQFKSSWLGNYFTKTMLPNAQTGLVNTKMSSPKDHAPKAIPESHAVIAEFIEHQERLLKLIGLAADVNLQTTQVPISISRFVRLRLGDVFLFLIAHQYRHILQAERALQKQPSLRTMSLPRLAALGGTQVSD